MTALVWQNSYNTNIEEIDKMIGELEFLEDAQKTLDSYNKTKNMSYDQTKLATQEQNKGATMRNYL